MSAAASISAPRGNNTDTKGPANSHGNRTAPSNESKPKTIEDIRKIVEPPRDREPETFPEYTREHISTLKLARKEVMEFYNSLTEAGKATFLEGGELAQIDPELWLELLEPHLTQFNQRFTHGERKEILERLTEFTGDNSENSKISREMICASDLPIHSKLSTMKYKDMGARLVLLDYIVANRDVVAQGAFKQHILGLPHELEFWIRKGVVSYRDLHGHISGGDLLNISPGTLANIPTQEIRLPLYWYKRSQDFDNLEERVGLMPEGLTGRHPRLGVLNRTEMASVIRSQRENLVEANTEKRNFITPEIAKLWQTAYSEAGIAPSFTLAELCECDRLETDKLDQRELQSFLQWWNELPEDKYRLNTGTVISLYERVNATEIQSGGWAETMALFLSNDSLTSKCDEIQYQWNETSRGIERLFRSKSRMSVPQTVDWLSDRLLLSYPWMEPWLENNQDQFLKLLQKDLKSFKSHPTEIAEGAARLSDIYAGALFLRAHKPRECAKIIARCRQLAEYDYSTEEFYTLHELTVKVAYHKVTTVPKETLKLYDETKLYDNNRLSWMVPAGNRWIFMEGLEQPKHEILQRACNMLHDLISNELKVDRTERTLKTKERRWNLEQMDSLLTNIDPSALSETEQVYHKALAPLFKQLLLWANRDKTDIEMIVDIQRSGLARPADPTDKVQIAPGNHFDWLQKKHQESEFSYLSRECPVLNPERYKRNLLALCGIKASEQAKQTSSARSSRIPPAIPQIRTDPAILYKVSRPLSGDDQYLTTTVSARMESDYSYAPLLAGALADFIRGLPKDHSRRKVTLSADLVGDGSIIPCPHHGSVESDSMRFDLENTSLATHPDGVVHIKGGAGFANLSVDINLPTAKSQIDSSARFEQVKHSLSGDIYKQLTSPISKLKELPLPLQKAIRTARGMSVASAAQFLEGFVRDNYVYSFDAANTDVYRQFQLQRAEGMKGDKNAYLEMIHALGDENCLGKGVCGQLSTVLFASLRLAGVPCVMTSGYLAVGKEIDEHMAHAYVSAILPTKEGSWRLKVLEATGGGVEGLIEHRRLELERLQKLENEGATLHKALFSQLVRPARQTNKWGWLASELEDGITDLTNEDADLFYSKVTRALGHNAVENPTSDDVADAYGKLLGQTNDHTITQLELAFAAHPKLHVVLTKAAEDRARIMRRTNELLGDLLDGGL